MQFNKYTHTHTHRDMPGTVQQIWLIPRALVIIVSEQSVHCVCLFLCGFSVALLFRNFLFCCLDLPPLGASLLVNGLDLTAWGFFAHKRA